MRRNVVSVLIIGLLLTMTLASCRTVGELSKLTPPILTAQPSDFYCKLNQKESICVALLKEDWKDVVRWIKHACLASGGSDEECGVVDE